MRKFVILLLVLHGGMLSWSAYTHSPLVDEPAHLASGLSHWRLFSFDLYRVNPPLVRTIASLPLLFTPHEMNWDSYSGCPYKRAEFPAGSDLLKKNTRKYHYMLVISRLFCIPFSLLGGLICYLWSRDLFGEVSGYVALILWCFSPLVLAFGYTIMPDVACASLGITACYFFWKWLKNPTWKRTLLTGIFLGIAELTKFTLVVLYPTFLLIWLISFIQKIKTASQTSILGPLKQLVTIFAISLYLINMIYGFEGSFTQLKKYEFVSRSLCGDTKWNHEYSFTATGNRFRESVLGEIPVPLPVNYVMGIDVQKKDFELGQASYFLGKWSNKGWYQYYIIGLLIKEPLGFWCLLVCSLIAAITTKNRSNFISEVVLLLPIVIILILISSQTKLNHHLRYAIPILPFLFISISRIGVVYSTKKQALKIIAVLFLVWSVVSSLLYYPHSQAHFNELIGSRCNAPQYLLGSNIDWGQNTLYLEKWLREHPKARPLGSYYESLYEKEHTNIKDDHIYFGMQPPNEPEPGWYALGVNEIYSSSKQYEYFKRLVPVDTIGYSIYIYHISPDEANRVRREMGLPEIECGVTHD